MNLTAHYFPGVDRDGAIEWRRHPADLARLVAASLALTAVLLLTAIEAYLDVCLANHAVKALVFDSRAQGSLTTTMQEREEMFAQLAQPSLRAMGISPAPIAARLFVAMTSEAALIELEAGRKVPGARRTVFRACSAA